MYKLIIALLCIGLTTALNAQDFLTAEEKQFCYPMSDTKGDVEEIESWSFHEIGGLNLQYHHLTKFQNQRPVSSTSYEHYGKSTTAYSYLPDGRLSKQITTRVDTLKDTTLISTSRHYNYQGRKIKVTSKFMHNSKTRYFELGFDQHSRLVTYKSYYGTQLEEDKAYTYDFNSKERKILNALTTKYEKGQVKKTISEIYNYSPAEVNGLSCTKIFIEKGSSEGEQNYVEHWEEYRLPDGNEIKGKAFYFRNPSKYEYRYTYDKRGNWIISERYKLPSGRLESYIQRKITYTDGYSTALPDFDAVKVSEKKLELDPNDHYTFKRYTKPVKSYNLFDINNKAVNRTAINMGSLGTDHFFLYYPPTQSVIELSNYQRVKENQRSDARVLSSNLSRYVFNSENAKFWFFEEGKEIAPEHRKLIRLTKSCYVVSFKGEEKSYTIKWPKNTKRNFVRPFHPLPSSHNNTYWYKFLTKNNKEADFVFFERGKVIKPKDTSLFKGVLEDGKDLIIMTVNDRYRLKNWKGVAADSIYRTYAVSELEYEKAMADYLEQLAKKEEVKATKTTKTVKANQNNFGCYSDIACLNGKAVQRFKAARAAGQSEEQAYQQMAQVYETVYQNKKELSFDMMMKIEGEYMMGLTKALPSEVRTYIRARSKQQVNKYVKKHGAPKIKTVPYQPKN